MTKLKRNKPKTEIEQIKEAFPNYDKTKLRAEYDSMGNIISIETDDKELIKILKVKGLIEK